MVDLFESYDDAQTCERQVHTVIKTGWINIH